MPPNLTMLLAIALAWVGTSIGLFIGGDVYRGRQDKVAYDGAMAKLEASAQATLATATEAARASENRANTLADTVETSHVDAEKKLAGVVADYDTKLRGKRLRDPAGGAGGSCPASGASAPPGSSPQPAPELGCTLSDAASDGLKRVALEADAFRLYAISCHQWAMELKR